jgi:hemerythrin-like domain-containing protein
MVVKLGQKRRPDDVVGRLVDCHDRIRSFVDVVVRLSAAETLTGDEVKSAARDVHRYFTEALPRHVEDEEMSILPRLVGRDPDLDAALERMHGEHEEHEAPVSELVSICGQLALESEAKVDRERLVALGVELGGAFSAHLLAEETIIFPAIDRWIPSSEQQKILVEMKQRRG